MPTELAAFAEVPIALPQRIERNPDPLLDTGPDGSARRIAATLGDRHPVTAFLIVILVGYAVLVALSVGLGFIITRLILSVGGVDRTDERFVTWLVSHRTDAVEDVSWVGSTLAGGHVIPAIIGLVLVVAAIFRRWRIGAFVLFAVTLETATYRVTTAFVPRERPDVERLEALPVNASYPSGHTAAAIALFGSLALLATCRLQSTSARVAIWVATIALVVFVAFSRVVRGMHHPLDVLGGIVIGVGALLIALLAARVAGAVLEQREGKREVKPT